MQYSILKNLLTHYLPPTDVALNSGGEIADCAYLRDAVNSIIGSHQDSEELDKTALDALVNLLITRFDYIRRFTILYTLNSISHVNRFCVALATELQRATGINRFQLLMHSLKSTKSATGISLDSDDVAVTDFILTNKQRHFIDLAECLRLAENNKPLRHTQRVSKKSGKPLLLSSEERAHVLAHSKVASDYYAAIKAHADGMRDGVTMTTLLNDLATGLEQGSELSQTNTGSATYQAIMQFHLVYEALPDTTKSWLNALSANGKTFKEIWEKLALQYWKKADEKDEKHDLLALLQINDDAFASGMLSENLKNIIEQHLQELSACKIDYQNMHEHTAGIANAKHWFISALKQLREGKAHLYEPIMRDQDQALTKLVLDKMNPRLLKNLENQLRSAMQISDVITTESVTLIFMKTGDLYILGEANSGQIHKTPVKVAGIKREKISHIVKIDNSISLHMQDGKTYKFGSRPFDLIALFKAAGIESNIVQHARCRQGREFMLTADGSVYSAGWKDKSLVPKKVRGIPGKVTQIKAGSDHALFLTDAGKLYVLGENRFGQLGLNDEKTRESPTLITAINEEITQIAAANDFSLMLTKSGVVYTCGKNFDRDSDVDGSHHHSNTPTKMNGIKDKITQIAAGEMYALQLTEAGEVYYCGVFNDYHSSSTPAKLKGITSKVTQLVPGDYHAFLRTEDNVLYGYGEFARGNLGIGKSKDKNKPYVVPVAFNCSQLLKEIKQRLKQAISLSAAPSATTFAAKPRESAVSASVEAVKKSAQRFLKAR